MRRACRVADTHYLACVGVRPSWVCFPFVLCAPHPSARCTSQGFPTRLTVTTLRHEKVTPARRMEDSSGGTIVAASTPDASELLDGEDSPASSVFRLVFLQDVVQAPRASEQEMLFWFGNPRFHIQAVRCVVDHVFGCAIVNFPAYCVSDPQPCPFHLRFQNCWRGY